jgi:hypothetical protein
MPQFQLEGEVDTRDQTIDMLRRQLAQMDEALRLERNKVGQVEAALRELRKITLPFHRLLMAVHGELDGLGIDAAASAVNGDPRWESWKAKMPGRPAEMIDLLRLHKSMSTKALMAAMHCAKDTVYQAAYKLGQAGLLASNSPYSLKELP